MIVILQNQQSSYTNIHLNLHKLTYIVEGRIENNQIRLLMANTHIYLVQNSKIMAYSQKIFPFH